MLCSYDLIGYPVVLFVFWISEDSNIVLRADCNEYVG